MRKVFSASIAATLASFAAVAAASSPMDLSIIDRAVAEFTGAGIGQPGGAKLPVDRRMRLVNCQSPLDLRWFGRDQRSVQVSCPSSGWRLFVAVDGANGVGGGSNQTVKNSGEVIVRRGETVSILVSGRGFNVTRQGTAAEDGAQGDWIKVRANGERTETVRAAVLRHGQVGIKLP